MSGWSDDRPKGVHMKKIVLASILILLLIGGYMGRNLFLSAFHKKVTEVVTDVTGAPSFSDERKLEYTYIVDGRQYSDRLITSEEAGAFDFLKFVKLLGVENTITDGKISLSYVGLDMLLEEDTNDFYSIILKEKKTDFGIRPYKKNGIIYISEEEVKGISDSKKLPLNVEINEEKKTVSVTNPIFSSGAEPVKYLDMAIIKGKEATLILDGRTMKISLDGVEYEKEVEAGYIDGKIVAGKDNKSDIIVYLWDGEKVKTIPLKLG